MKIRFVHISFIAFILLNLLDPVFYSINHLGQFNIPIGFLGILLTFFLLIKSFVPHGKIEMIRLTYMWFIILLLLLILLSENGKLGDLYFWFGSVAFFVFGTYFYMFLSENRGLNKHQIFLFIFTIISFYLMFIFIKLDMYGINYLRIADSYTLLSVLFLSYIRNNIVFWIVVLLSTATLYFVGSRFSMFSLVIAVMLVQFLVLNLKKKIFFLITVLISSTISLNYAYQVYLKVDNIHNSRFLRLIFERESDTSLLTRISLYEDALNVFKNNYIFGNYKYYRLNGMDGDYAHNFLSFWSEFGLLGVLLSIVLFVVNVKAFMTALKEFKDQSLVDQNKPKLMFVLLSTVIVILGFSFSKSYVWSSLYFITGISLYYILLRSRTYNFSPININMI